MGKERWIMIEVCLGKGRWKNKIVILEKKNIIFGIIIILDGFYIKDREVEEII